MNKSPGVDDHKVASIRALVLFGMVVLGGCSLQEEQKNVGQLALDLEPKIVLINCQTGPEKHIKTSFGSGIMVSSDGLILTNHHVIAQQNSITIHLWDGRQFNGKVHASDPTLDLALVKIPGNKLPFVKLEKNVSVNMGDSVFAVGFPLGSNFAVSMGIVSALQVDNLHTPGKEAYLQTDAALSRGHSGGPLVSLNGEIVGVNTAISAMGTNIGYAIPIPVVVEFCKPYLIP